MSGNKCKLSPQGKLHDNIICRWHYSGMEDIKNNMQTSFSGVSTRAIHRAIQISMAIITCSISIGVGTTPCYLKCLDSIIYVTFLGRFDLHVHFIWKIVNNTWLGSVYDACMQPTDFQSNHITVFVNLKICVLGHSLYV